MKWQKHLLGICFIFSVLAACNDSDTDDPAPSTQTATTTSATAAPSTETLKSDAKVKGSDAAAKRLKGTVQMMTEEVYPDEKAQKFTFKNVFKYDVNGNQLELSNYKSDGSLVSTIKSAYDAAGKVVSEETLVANGLADIKSEIKTDEKGNRVEQMDIKQGSGGNNLFNYKYIYKYDKDAHLIERLGYRGNGAFFLRYLFNYDANGNRTEWIQMNQLNEVTGKVVYKYDDKKNIIAETSYKPDGSVKADYTYTYDFDRKGNWTRQKKMQRGVVVEVRKREYQYF